MKLQRFGHTAIHCNFPYRCVKCNENRGPMECKIEKSSVAREDLYCTLCQQKMSSCIIQRMPEIQEDKEKNARKETIKHNKQKTKTVMYRYTSVACIVIF